MEVQLSLQHSGWLQALPGSFRKVSVEQIQASSSFTICSASIILLLHCTLSCTAPQPLLCLPAPWDHPTGELWGQDRPPKGRTPPHQGCALIWYRVKMLLSSCLVEALESVPSHSPNRMALVYPSRGGKWCVMSQNGVCEPGSCWDLTKTAGQIHRFSDSKSCLFLLINFLAEVPPESSRITQLREALGSRGLCCSQGIR